MAEAPILNIVGEKVALGPHRRDLLPLYQAWVNDWEVTRGVAGIRPWTAEAEEAWYDRVEKDGGVHFTIYERETVRPVGTTALHEINHRHGTAEFGILIGAKDCWGRGYGTETARLMLDYAFHGLGLHNVMLQVYSFNAPAIRAYEKAGFREIGRRREALRLGQNTYDNVYMDCLATEFQSPVLHNVMPQNGPP